ncbi:MAG: ABC transporter substrate-binding protein [Synechococcales cyanobacterium]
MGKIKGLSEGLRVKRRALIMGSLAVGLTAAQPLQRVVLASDWYAQAEHGGFYQAIATGIYAQAGLDVHIQIGNTSLSIMQLLAARAVDFAMGAAVSALQSLAAGIPVVTVAALFQKNPQVLLTHPHTPPYRLEDLRGHPIYVSAGANVTYWPFLRQRYGFDDGQKRPYTGSLAPFLLDAVSVQQGYLTSEPYRVRQEAGFDPGVILLADYGYNPYATTIETRQELVREKPDLVRRFVQASIQGWESYLRDPAPAHGLIKQNNPNISDGLLAYAHRTMQEQQIVQGGDAIRHGIGTMNPQRWQAMAELLVSTGAIPQEIPYAQAFTLEFVG